jgi:hypothetical protein
MVLCCPDRSDIPWPISEVLCNYQKKRGLGRLAVPLSRDPYPAIDPVQLRLLITDVTSQGYDLLLTLDCRFEYECAGGHIRGSLNVQTMADMKDLHEEFRECNIYVVFHCEFSKNRGPTIIQAFRQHDRLMNSYLDLDFEDVFLLEGGYCRFYAECPDLCDSGYVTMCDEAFVKSGDVKRSHAAYSREWMDAGRMGRGLRKTHSGADVQLRSFQLAGPLLPPPRLVSAMPEHFSWPSHS